MYKLPEKVKNLIPYEPLTGNYRVRLDANESFLAAPPEMAEEIACEVAQMDFNRYPDPYCVELCRAFAEFYKVDPACVVAGNGSDELIGLIVSWFTVPGDRMITLSPDFSMYAFYAQSCGVTLETIDKEKDSLALHADTLISRAKETDARLVIFSNPCNPTSLSASREDVLKIADSLPDCLVVADEAYMDFSEGSVLPFAAERGNLIVLKTCSKAFGMAAIRLGFAAACPTLTDALKAAKSPYNVNAMTQAAGRILFSHPDYLRDCIEEIKRSRDGLYELICTLAAQTPAILEVECTCANFVFLRLTNAESVYEALKARGVAVRLMGNRLRITAGALIENRAVVSALKLILQ